MADQIRAHVRVENREYEGSTFSVRGILERPVEVYLPSRVDTAESFMLLIHFHGASYVPKYAVKEFGRPVILAVVNLGSGSSVYERPFQETGCISSLVDCIGDSVAMKWQRSFSKIYFSSFSAGYGAVRAILREDAVSPDGILLMDGLHTDYIPEGTVLYEGGALNEDKMAGFLRFAELALGNEKRLVITHSEIFPGTYASTTETADYLIQSLSLERTPVVKWGPVGMQMIAETRSGGFSVLAFAGKTARDHVDHYHGMSGFLHELFGPQQ